MTTQRAKRCVDVVWRYLWDIATDDDCRSTPRRLAKGVSHAVAKITTPLKTTLQIGPWFVKLSLSFKIAVEGYVKYGVLHGAQPVKH